MLALQNTGREAPDLPGLELAPLDSAGQRRSEVRALRHRASRPRTAWDWLSSSTPTCSTATTVLRLAGHLRNLLAAAVADPGRRLSELPLLDSEERHQLAFELGSGPVARRAARCLHQLFEEQAARTPGALALLDLAEEMVTYAELARRAERLARTLRACGVGPEVPVGVCLDRSLDLPLAMLAIWKAGGVYLPLDPAYPRERLDLMLRDSGARIVLTCSRLAAGLPTGSALLLAWTTLSRWHARPRARRRCRSRR